MAVKYYILPRKELTVRVWVHDGSINSRLAERCLTDAEAAEITDYVELHELGRRTAYDIWQMKNTQSLTLFMLHYG